MRSRTPAPGPSPLLLTATLLTAMALLSPAVLAAPPQPGASGIDGSCQSCHVGVSGAEVGASLAIGGVPETFEPGHRYTLSVTLDRGSGPHPHFVIVHGFQLACSSGSLAASDTGTVQVSEREVGSRGAVETSSWTSVWTAPEDDEDVAFFAQAVVGDGDGTEGGDVTLEAQARSYGPLRVPPEDEPGPSPWRYAAVTISVITLVVLGYVVAFTHRRPPPREEDL